MQKLNYAYKELKLKYYLSGKGNKTILLLHGWSSSIKSYPRLIQLLNDLKFNTVFLEFPGHGESDDLNEPWTVKDFNELVVSFVNFLEKEHSLKLNAVYGHSNGGRVLLGALPKLDKKLNVFLVASAGLPFRKNLFQKLVSYLSPLAKVFKYIPFFKFFRKLILKSIKAHDYLNVKESMKETFVNLINYNSTDKLRYISQESHLIYGDQDQLTPLYMAEEFKRGIKNSKLVVLPNMTHGIHIKDPDFLAKYINQHTS